MIRRERPAHRGVAATVVGVAVVVAAAWLPGTARAQQPEWLRTFDRPFALVAEGGQSRTDPPAANVAQKRVPRQGTGFISGRTRAVRLGERHSRAELRRARKHQRKANPGFNANPRGGVDPQDTPFTPIVPPTADGGGAAARATQDPEFELFSSSVPDAGDGSDVSEPTAANDRHAVLATGNWWAATSGNHGESWTELNPSANAVHGGFCCDQVAYSVDRGPRSLVFWLRQYQIATSGTRQNALRIDLFTSASDLLDGVSSCQWDFDSVTDFGLPSGYWFDYNRVSHTDDFLYVTTNVKDNDEDDERVGAMIFRMSLDAIDDGDCDIGFRYWFEEGHPYIAPVQNAGSTMFLATHAHDVVEGDQLRIYSIADSSTELEHTTKNIENFASANVDRDCPLPGGQDPCDRLHPDQVTGFRSGSTVGWMWTAPQDGEFPFPHVRVAVYETSDLDEILEHQIWSQSFAWTLPSVGVNASGDLGVTLYAMGGGRNPNAQAFLRTDPRVWTGIQMNALVNSNSGAADWGDYATVRPYGDCPDTFLGIVWTRQSSETENRVVWFGDEDEGCADLAVTGSFALPGVVKQTQEFSVTQTTRNLGSGTAGASTTRYYLSRDAVKSSDDILLGAVTPVIALPRNGQVTGPVAQPVVPFTADLGSYYLISCADDRSTVDEITSTNNCFTNQTITVEQLTATEAHPVDVGAVITSGATSVARARSTLPVTLSLRLRPGARGPTTVTYLLSRTTAPRRDARRIGRFRVRGSATGKARVVRARHRLKLPAGVRGRRHLLACVGTSRKAARCLPAARPLRLVR